MRLLLQGCTEVLVFGFSLLFFRWDLWCHVFVCHDVWHEIFMHSWIIPSSAQTLGVRECGSYILKSNRFDTVSLEIRYWIVSVVCNILLQVWVDQWHQDRKAMLTGSTLIALPGMFTNSKTHQEAALLRRAEHFSRRQRLEAGVDAFRWNAARSEIELWQHGTWRLNG